MVVAPVLHLQVVRRVQRLSTSVEKRLAGLGRFALFAAKVLGHAMVDVIGRRRFWRVVLRHTSDIVAGAGAVVVGGGMVFVVAAMALAVGVSACEAIQAISSMRRSMMKTGSMAQSASESGASLR